MKYFSGLSNAKSREAHMSYLAREVGNIWRCSSREKGNMINEFKYGQTWNNWPSPLSLSLNSTFKQRIKWNSKVFLFVSFYREGRRIGIAANSSVQTVTKLQTFVIKNLKNSRCANLSPNRKSHLLFILSQSKPDI